MLLTGDLLYLVPVPAVLAVYLEVDLVLVAGPRHQPRLDVDQVHALVLEHLERLAQPIRCQYQISRPIRGQYYLAEPRHARVQREDDRRLEGAVGVAEVVDTALLQGGQLLLFFILL